MPQPATTGGGMGYPNTVDSGQIQPFILTNVTGQGAAATSATTAGAAFFVGVELYAPITIAQMRTVFSGAPTGNVDMGIYDATGANGGPGNLLGHTGAIVATTGVFTKALTANLLLSPGQYWLAFLDTVADSVAVKTMQGANVGAVWRSVSTALAVLPASAGSVQTTTVAILLDGLISGGFS